MKKLVGVMIAMSYILNIGACEATIEVVRSDDTYTVGPGGHYQN